MYVCLIFCVSSHFHTPPPPPPANQDRETQDENRRWPADDPSTTRQVQSGHQGSPGGNGRKPRHGVSGSAGQEVINDSILTFSLILKHSCCRSDFCILSYDKYNILVILPRPKSTDSRPTPRWPMYWQTQGGFQYLMSCSETPKPRWPSMDETRPLEKHWGNFVMFLVSLGFCGIMFWLDLFCIYSFMLYILKLYWLLLWGSAGDGSYQYLSCVYWSHKIWPQVAFNSPTASFTCLLCICPISLYLSLYTTI